MTPSVAPKLDGTLDPADWQGVRAQGHRVLVARTAALGPAVRRRGVAASGKRLIAYTSAAAHGCIGQAMDLSGLGSAALHVIPTDDHYRIDLAALENTIAADRRKGFTPFL